MNKSATPPPVPRRRSNQVISVIIVCLVCLPVLAVLITFASYRVSNGSAIRRLESKIKQNKEPLTLDDLAATYLPIPDEENGAIPLMELWEKDSPEYWKAFRNGERSLPERPESTWDDALPYLGSGARHISRSADLQSTNLSAAENYLKERKEHMDGVRRALLLPHFRFPVQITNAYLALIPHLSQIKKEAQSFQIEALVATEHGDIDGAINAFQQSALLGKMAVAEPFLIGQLVGIACYQMTLNGTERLLSRRALSSQQFAQVERLVYDMQMPDAFYTSLVSERVAALSVFDLPPQAIALLGGQSGDELDESSEVGSRIGMSLGMGILNATGIKDADRRLLLETMDQAITLARQDDPEALEQIEWLFQDLEVEVRKFPPKIFCGMLLPALGKAVTKFASFEARRRAAMVAVAVERYRLAHEQRMPQQLEELSPRFLSEIPIDPFDGEPIRYKRLPTGFTVYSIGVNRVDDDGKERPRKGSAKDFDDTFIIER